MGLTSLQVCMDSTHWLEGSLHDDSGMDSSSSPSGDMLACSRPLMERRLRPQHDQPLKCPRCESTHTKFCYYNNYSLSQPRYFCKTCRRYWTKGGTLRNIPVGGGCRKNKKAASSKKPSEHHSGPMLIQSQGSSSSLARNPTDLHLSFPHDHMQLSPHLGNLLVNGPFSSANSFLDGTAGPIDFMDSKLEAIVGGNPSRSSYDFMGNNPSSEAEQVPLGVLTGGSFGDLSGNSFGPNFHGLCSPYGIIPSSIDVPNSVGANFMENNYQNATACIDVKPNPKLLISLEWQDQNCSDSGKNINAAAFEGYGFNGLGSSWTGIVNEYGSHSTNHLV